MHFLNVLILKMLRLTLEIVPFGVEKLKKELGILEICNDGSGDEEVGNYFIRYRQSLVEKKTRKVGRIDGYVRGQKSGAWRLSMMGIELFLSKLIFPKRRGKNKI